MGYRPTRTAYRELAALAQTQGGYFTAKQAAGLGYKYPHLVYHVGAGNFERAGHGVYRLPELPFAEHDDLVRLSFWSRDREGRPQAVASHQTALALHELSDLLPVRTYLTVPPSFRKPAPKGIVLRRAELSCEDTEEREGFFVTTPLRTLIDVAEDRTISAEHVLSATREAIHRGMVVLQLLDKAIASHPDSAQLGQVFRLSDMR